MEYSDRTPPHAIILFDGVCNLCNASVTFIIERDPSDRFRFAALQSDLGRKLTSKFGIDSEKTDSIVLLEGDTAYTKSTAALRIARKLSGAWPLLYSFIIIPKPLRDWVYGYIAKNRYRWYGKQESCMIPTPALREKFL
jgi:predicted DCC family thiol-disulfide oxidoreductase YuxK